jgi:hypothetical protein
VFWALLGRDVTRTAIAAATVEEGCCCRNRIQAPGTKGGRDESAIKRLSAISDKKQKTKRVISIE